MASHPTPPQLTLGTRASPLAVRQSELVAAALCAAHGWAESTIELATIVTKGDVRLDAPLADIGGKGLFTEELEAGLREGTLNFAVHSLKDLPTVSPDDLALGAILPREDARDVLVPRAGLAFASLADLPEGARVGTASLRRKAQILHTRPDLHVAPLRGNVATRMAGLEAQDLHATLLAAAGLHRLQIMPEGAAILAPQEMLPAAGQGALAVQYRTADTAMRDWLAAVHCADTAACVTAERVFLNALDGSCRTPIAAHATLQGGKISLTGRLLSDDGKEAVEGQLEGARADADRVGRALAEDLRQRAPHLVR